MANIGTGGMAEVHLARQRGPMGFEKLVVVKCVHRHLAAQRDFIDMLLEEARIAALVKHANVVDIYDLGEVDGSYFIAMEYLEGEPMLAILRAGKQGKRLDALSTTRLIADCAEGLHAAHELHAMSGQPLSVVHHDVSPGNVMVLYSGEVKLVDFGVAKAENQVEQAGERVLMKGKMSYMAPEKLRGQTGDRRSDVFSLGVVLWESMTLRRLFRADSDKEVARMIIESSVPPPSTVDPASPPELDAIVARAVAKDPEQRYPTAKAMAAALEEFLRKSGYSGKNDRIGEYMHATFGDRLAARRELIRSMSGTGAGNAPSPQAIARAFRADPTIGVPIPDSLKRSRSGLTPLPLPLPPPGVSRAQTEELSTFTEVEAYQEPSDLKNWIVDDARTVMDDDGILSMDVTPVPPARRDAVVIGALIALAMLVAVIGFVLTRDRGDRSVASGATDEESPFEAPREPVVAAVPDPQPTTAPVIGDLGGPTPRPTPAPAPGDQPVADKPRPDRQKPGDRKPDVTKPDVRKPDDRKVDDRKVDDRKVDDKKVDDKQVAVAPAPTPPPAQPPTATNAAGLVKDGMKLFISGKQREALASFEQARKKAPGYAPAYRGIGMAKQGLGDKTGAATAFRKYLELAPSAGDAGQIKKRLEKL
jgi:serine/threonine protein kinase/outer membrane biosynthesis protein TonB